MSGRAGECFQHDLCARACGDRVFRVELLGVGASGFACAAHLEGLVVSLSQAGPGVEITIMAVEDSQRREAAAGAEPARRGAGDAVTREYLWGDAADDSLGLAGLRRALQRPGPDEGLAYRELTRAEADDFVVAVVEVEPRLCRVLAEVVRQMEASGYLDGRPASRLLPLLAEFVSAV